MPTNRLNLLLPRLALERDLDFVAQAEPPDMYHALGSQSEDPYATTLPDYLTRIYGASDTRRLDDFLARRVTIFFGVDAWLRYLTDQHLVFGTRLHGAIAGLLAGIPSVLVTHDTRTAEMPRHASIPSVSAEVVTEDIDFRHIYDTCDAESFNRSTPAYYKRFADFFDANGLRHRLRPGTESTHDATAPLAG